MAGRVNSATKYISFRQNESGNEKRTWPMAVKPSTISDCTPDGCGKPSRAYLFSAPPPRRPAWGAGGAPRLCVYPRFFSSAIAP